jgi:hypothetical protein
LERLRLAATHPEIAPSRLYYFIPIAVNHGTKMVHRLGVPATIVILQKTAILAVLFKEVGVRHALFHLQRAVGADGGTRTHNAQRPRDFKSRAYANSATSAKPERPGDSTTRQQEKP